MLNKEGAAPKNSNNTNPFRSEEERFNLYGQILYREATTILKTYLPEALPQEPTELFFDVQPFYIGKFIGTHYITAEKTLISQKYLDFKEKQSQWEKAKWEKYVRDEKEYWRLFAENLDQGIVDEELESKVFTSDPVKEPPIDVGTEDWEDPERLLQGRAQYSFDTWRGIYVLTHELIHQRQAELNPQAYPDLVSPKLDQAVVTAMPRADLKEYLTEAHRDQNRKDKTDSLFFPVVEGIAELGTYFSFGRFITDVEKEADPQIIAKLKSVRSQTIRIDLTPNDDSYDNNYIVGVGMVRKLYKQSGIDSARYFLQTVDLNACRNITQGSVGYTQIVENPLLLPRFATAP